MLTMILCNWDCPGQCERRKKRTGNFPTHCPAFYWRYELRHNIFCSSCRRSSWRIQVPLVLQKRQVLCPGLRMLGLLLLCCNSVTSVTFGAGLGKRKKRRKKWKSLRILSPCMGLLSPTPLSKKIDFSWGFCYLWPA